MTYQQSLSRSGRWTQITIACVTLALVLGCGKPVDPVGKDVEHFLAAQEALERGDKDTALQELNASIEVRPDGWAYYYRAKLHSDSGNDELAIADCEAGMELDPDHPELKWLRAELKKQPSRRFKGRNASAPTSGK